jgi:hypothetical protein
MSSIVVDVNSWYLALVVERDTIVCFLAPLDNKLSPIYIVKTNSGTSIIILTYPDRITKVMKCS